MSDRLRIVVGSDDAGLTYKNVLTADLQADARVSEVIDVGAQMQCGPLASVAARVVTEGLADRALLICGTGLGVAMRVNKVQGLRAVAAADSWSVERSVLDNDAQILCFGPQVVSLDLARQLAREWLSHRFDHRSATNLAVIRRPA